MRSRCPGRSKRDSVHSRTHEHAHARTYTQARTRRSGFLLHVSTKLGDSTVRVSVARPQAPADVSVLLCFPAGSAQNLHASALSFSVSLLALPLGLFAFIYTRPVRRRGDHSRGCSAPKYLLCSSLRLIRRQIACTCAYTRARVSVCACATLLSLLLFSFLFIFGLSLASGASRCLLAANFPRAHCRGESRAWKRLICL